MGGGGGPVDVVWIAVDPPDEPDDEVGGGSGVAKRGVVGYAPLGPSGSNVGPPGGAVGLGVVVGVVDVKGNGLQDKDTLRLVSLK